jgi:hypothetical protein
VKGFFQPIYGLNVTELSGVYCNFFAVRVSDQRCDIVAPEQGCRVTLGVGSKKKNQQQTNKQTKHKLRFSVLLRAQKSLMRAPAIEPGCLLGETST